MQGVHAQSAARAAACWRTAGPPSAASVIKAVLCGASGEAPVASVRPCFVRTAQGCAGQAAPRASRWLVPLQFPSIRPQPVQRATPSLGRPGSAGGHSFQLECLLALAWQPCSRQHSRVGAQAVARRGGNYAGSPCRRSGGGDPPRPCAGCCTRVAGTGVADRQGDSSRGELASRACTSDALLPCLPAAAACLSALQPCFLRTLQNTSCTNPQTFASYFPPYRTEVQI